MIPVSKNYAPLPLSYMYKMHTLLCPPVLSTHSLPFTSISFLIHSFLFCDPLNLIKTICVTMGLNLSIAIWWTHSWLHIWNKMHPLSQHLSLAGRDMAPLFPLLSARECWQSWSYVSQCKSTLLLWAQHCSSCAKPPKTAVSNPSSYLPTPFFPPFLPQCSWTSKEVA